jgi:hypothetical protein
MSKGKAGWQEGDKPIEAVKRIAAKTPDITPEVLMRLPWHWRELFMDLIEYVEATEAIRRMPVREALNLHPLGREEGTKERNEAEGRLDNIREKLKLIET